MIDISKAFNTFSNPLTGFFQEPGVGFYIPLYQREYSWDKENIEQLMEDICQGVENLMSDDEEIRFLGTIIRVKENNPRVNINPRDTRAFPARIDNVIDGQQRISTIALLGALLYQRLKKLGEKLQSFKVINTEILPSKLENILELFSVDLKRGIPHRKPIIIRGSVDTWTLDEEDTNYKSHVASYLAKILRSIHDKKPFPRIPKGHLVGKNLRLMDSWLMAVENAHLREADEEPIYSSAWDIIGNIDQVHIWDYERDELYKVVISPDIQNSLHSALCSLVQLLAFTHYLLNRCCFNVIDPISEAWAFDMFQSLNATGTPLTAVETFKPVVVNIANNEGGYKDSRIEQNFMHVDSLLSTETSAAQKSRLTNEFLSSFAHAYDGTKLARRFSSQRRWLIDSYNGCSSQHEREEFVKIMGEMAAYYHYVLNFDPDSSISLPYLNVSREEKELANVLCSLLARRWTQNGAHASKPFLCVCFA